jgi:hypothetical protein
VALRWDTLLAWACGATIYHVLANFWPGIGATLPALLLAGGLQFALGSFSRGRERIAL